MNLGGLRFAAEGYLVAVLLVVVTAGALAWFHRRRAQARAATASPELRPWVMPGAATVRHGVVTAGLIGTVLVLVLGAARPSRAVEVPARLSTVVVALDASFSMTAVDVEPSRIAAARVAAREFVRRLPRDVAVGYVVFSESASIEVAPTTDRDAVVRAIDDTRPIGGTAIGEAIFRSLDAVTAAQGLEVPPAVDRPQYPRLRAAAIVLLSDGESDSGRPPENAAAAAARARIPVSTIAFGTPGGTIGGGEPVPVNEEALRAVAERTGGRAFRAESAAELVLVYRDLGSRLVVRTVYRDVTTWFVAGALALALATVLVSLAWFRRMP